jgi:succinate dehydrogenase / fumarate reductase flavoprotein subunit
MEAALVELGALRQRAEKVGVAGHREFNTGWHAALDLRNLLTVSEAIARSALERRESRGGHFREDYPAKDPAYGGFNIVVRKDAAGGMSVERVPLPPMPEELKAIIEEMK